MHYDALRRTSAHRDECAHPDVFARLVKEVFKAPWIDPDTGHDWVITEKNPATDKARGYGKCELCAEYDSHIYNAPNPDKKNLAKQQKRAHVADFKGGRQQYATNIIHGMRDGVLSICQDAADQVCLCVGCPLCISLATSDFHFVVCRPSTSCHFSNDGRKT